MGSHRKKPTEKLAYANYEPKDETVFIALTKTGRNELLRTPFIVITLDDTHPVKRVLLKYMPSRVARAVERDERKQGEDEGEARTGPEGGPGNAPEENMPVEEGTVPVSPGRDPDAEPEEEGAEKEDEGDEY